MGETGEILQGTLEMLVLKALTLEAMHGWGIGNRIDPDLLYPKENLATLNQVLAAPCLGVIGYGVEPPAAAAALREAANAVRDAPG